MAIKRLVPSPVYSVYCRHRQSDCRGGINNEAGSRRTMLECCCRKLNSQKYQRTVGYPSTSWASCRVRADVRDIRQTDIRTDDGRRSPLNAPAPPLRGEGIINQYDMCGIVCCVCPGCSRRLFSFIILVVCVSDVFVDLEGSSVCSEAVCGLWLAETVFLSTSQLLAVCSAN